MSKISMNEEEIRVLGCLLEKKMTTPEYYPLTLNSLTTACNQKTNREPVVFYTEESVLHTLDSLKKKGLVGESHMSRSTKYNENLMADTKMLPKEAAVLSTLFLRGPQTPGEIKSRTERLAAFNSLDDLFQSLKELEEMDFIQQAERQPGQKESRFRHLLGESLPAEKTSSPITAITETIEQKSEERIEVLEKEVRSLKEELSHLKEEFNRFKDLF